MCSDSRSETGQCVLNSASALIYAHSYAEIGAAQNCADAGVSKGSFYHFFASKRGLMPAMLDIRIPLAEN